MSASPADPPLKRGIHPLRLLFLIVCAAQAFLLTLYLFVIFAFFLMPGGMD